MRSFRGTEAVDPATYITSILTVLLHYPIDVAWAIADPFSGIPGKQNWVPTPFEVRKACEEIEGPRRRTREWDARAAQQLAERKLLEDHSPRQTYAQAKAEMATRGIFFDGAGRPHIETADAAKRKFGLTDQEWDALPNLPGASKDWETTRTD